jgi:hypothetical protein
VVALAGAALLAALVSNTTAVARLVALDGPARFRLGAPLAFAAACLLAGASAFLAPRRVLVPRALAVVTLAATVGAFLPTPERAPAAGRWAGGAGAARTPLVLVGVDGADWRFIDRLQARGELPNLEALRRRGVSARLRTIRPTFSPAIWTSIVTGRPPKAHGIESFQSLRVEGVAGALPSVKLPRALGYGWLYRSLVHAGRVADGPVVSSARKVPAFWEIASAHGSPVAVVNFWATWPAEPIDGYVVSERVHHWRQADRGDPPETERLTYPKELYEEIRPLVMEPREVSFEHSRAFMDVSPAEFDAMRGRSVNSKTIEGEFKYLYSMFETERKVALHLVEKSRRERGAPADLLLLFRIVDIASHRSLAESELVDDHLDASADDRRRFGNVVSEAYRRVDQALGELLRSFDGEANVIVVSDHGFQRETFEGREVYQHRFAPPGIFLAAGPAFREAAVDDLHVYDVMPLLAAVKGFPVAEDLERTLRADVLRPEWLEANPVTQVASYGRRGAISAARAGGAADDAALERLRALGYVQ